MQLPVQAARQAEGAGEMLALAGEKREALARDVAKRAREVALATLSGETSCRGRNCRPRWRLYRAGGDRLMAIKTPSSFSEGPSRRRRWLARRSRASAIVSWVTTSLAGRTERPGPIPGQIRIGGFGGATGLAAYVQGACDRLLDRCNASVRGGGIGRSTGCLRARKRAAIDDAAATLAAASARPLDRGR